MREIKKINKEIVFDDAISEVTSISLDTDFAFSTNEVNGKFLISGTVREHDLSTLENDFDYEIPFTHTFEKEITSANVEVSDFTYDIDADRILLDIEYNLDYEELIDDRSEIEELMNDDDVIVCDLRDEDQEEKEDIIEEVNEPRVDEIVEEIHDDEEYISYHVYVADQFDTIESISSKYNISVQDLTLYNDVTEIKKGMKIIIPEVNE